MLRAVGVESVVVRERDGLAWETLPSITNLHDMAFRQVPRHHTT